MRMAGVVLLAVLHMKILLEDDELCSISLMLAWAGMLVWLGLIPRD